MVLRAKKEFVGVSFLTIVVSVREISWVVSSLSCVSYLLCLSFVVSFCRNLRCL